MFSTLPHFFIASFLLPNPTPRLSNYNQELVSCIEDLREKREELNRSLLKDEEEKAKIQKELATLTERLSRLNEDLARKMQVSSFLGIARERERGREIYCTREACETTGRCV